MKKRKKFQRKLKLNKETIASINPKRMVNLLGGRPTGYGTLCCVPCDVSEATEACTDVGKTCTVCNGG